MGRLPRHVYYRGNTTAHIGLLAPEVLHSHQSGGAADVPTQKSKTGAMYKQLFSDDYASSHLIDPCGQ